MSIREHWDEVYRTKAPDEVSWYRPRLDRSLEWIDRMGLEKSAHIVDVGGGASTLVDDLLARDFERLSVADISVYALEHSRKRLGDDAKRVRWIVGDVTIRLFDDDGVDLWHDRAVLHFLTDAARRDAYVEALQRALRPGGHAIIATFGPRGPDRCSGLPVIRYSSSEIAAVLGPRFELVDAADEAHVTPWGSVQAFAYALCRKKP